jgi:hypothetical protein
MGIGNFMKRRIVFLLVLVFGLSVVKPAAQEPLLSDAEGYYEFLALRGLTERPYLNYRTLSDSVWKIPEGAHPWQNVNLGTKRDLNGHISMKIYGPELFTSANTAAPYGQNDGALWQGRGLNMSLTGGVRFEAWGVEATFRPQLAFSQNAYYLTMPKSPDIESQYGYFWGTIDYPQRFGDKPFFEYDWGDSELRYSYKSFTVGIGTQAIWLGPAYLNSILHSNNAPSYPKFDIGLRKQQLYLTKKRIDIWAIESRLWLGVLSESAYFDANPSNDHQMFHGLTFAYTLPVFSSLTFFFNRVCLVPWKLENLRYLVPMNSNTYEDQKMSFGFVYLEPRIGFELYGEAGLDDFVPGGFLGYLRYPFHTFVYTLGLKKTINLSRTRGIYGEIIFEWTNMEMSQDFQLQWAYSFYRHGNIKQGYTNGGQYLGAGSGYAGNSQYLEFKIYYPQGSSSLFFHRGNPDNNYIYSQAVNAAAGKGLEEKYFTSFKSDFVFGLSSKYYITRNFSLGGSVAYDLIINPRFDLDKSPLNQDTYWHNVYLNVVLKYEF